MTDAVTGMDIRRALLSENLRPSNYDEQGVFEYIHSQHRIDAWTPRDIVEIAQERFKIANNG